MTFQRIHRGRITEVIKEFQQEPTRLDCSNVKVSSTAIDTTQH